MSETKKEEKYIRVTLLGGGGNFEFSPKKKKKI